MLIFPKISSVPFIRFLYLASKEKEEKYTRVINAKSLQKFKETTNGEFLTKVAKKIDRVDKKYELWQNEIKNIIEKCFIRKRKNTDKKQQNKLIKNLYRIKRKRKRIYLVEEPKTQTKIMKYRIQNNLIKEYITNEEAKLRDKVIKNEIRNIEEEGGLNSTAFWEFKKRMDKNGKQKESINGMLNKEGKTVTGKDEIKTVFKDFCTGLFKINNGGN